MDIKKHSRALSLISIFSLFLLISCGGNTTSKEGGGADSLATKTDSTPTQVADAGKAKTKPWIFEQTGTGKFDEPLTKISVVANEKTYVVAKSVMGSANVLEKTLWVDYKIPAKATSACMAWWAGEGDVFYLIAKKDGFLVWHAVIFEGMDMEKEIKYEKAVEVSGLIKQ